MTYQPHHSEDVTLKPVAGDGAAAPVGEPTVQPAEDMVLIPRGLIGAACAAIDHKHPAPKLLEHLRRYTFGDRAASPAAPAGVPTDLAEWEQPTWENLRHSVALMLAGATDKPRVLCERTVDALAETGALKHVRALLKAGSVHLPACDSSEASGSAIPARPTLPGEDELQKRIAELVEQHGSLRAAARVLETDAGYLSCLRSGEKDDPGETLLRRMGLRRVVAYERAGGAMGRSLLRKVGDKPTVCYCPPNVCQAPKPEWCIGRRAAEVSNRVDLTACPECIGMGCSACGGTGDRDCALLAGGDQKALPPSSVQAVDGDEPTDKETK